MYKDLINICYPFSKKGTDSDFRGVVTDWQNHNKQIFIVEREGKILGFSLSYIVSCAVLAPYYRAELIYIKPEHRHTKASFLLYANLLQIANSLKLDIHTASYLGNDSAKIMQKYATPAFVEFIRVFNG